MNVVDPKLDTMYVLLRFRLEMDWIEANRLAICAQHSYSKEITTGISQQEQYRRFTSTIPHNSTAYISITKIVLPPSYPNEEKKASTIYSMHTTHEYRKNKLNHTDYVILEVWIVISKQVHYLETSKVSNGVKPRLLLS